MSSFFVPNQIRQRDQENDTEDKLIAERIATTALETCQSQCMKFLQPPPQQQPMSSVFAAFVLEQSSGSSSSLSDSSSDSSKTTFKTVSFGLGTHAVGTSPTFTAESINFCLNDLHAEVLARKGLISYLLDRALNFNENDNLFEFIRSTDDSTSSTSTKIRFKSEMNKIHLFVTQTPCGEASVFPGARHGARCFKEVKIDVKEVSENNNPLLLRHCRCFSNHQQQQQQQRKVEEDDLAILVSDHCNGADDDDENRTRLKPGKGIRSTSMSCSDKISKWIELGLAGAAAGNGFTAPSKLKNNDSDNLINHDHQDVALSSIVVLVDSDDEGKEVVGRMRRAFFHRHKLVVIDDDDDFEDIVDDDNNNKTTVVTARDPEAPRLAYFVSSSSSISTRRPFPRTSSELSSSSVCLVGKSVLSSLSNFEVKQLTGKEGALQGSNATVRSNMLNKTLKSEGMKFVSSQEHPFCRLGLMRSVVMLLKRLNCRNEDEEGKVVTLAELKQMNVKYSERERRFHSVKKVFRDWVVEKNEKEKDECVKLMW